MVRDISFYSFRSKKLLDEPIIRKPSAILKLFLNNSNYLLSIKEQARENFEAIFHFTSTSRYKPLFYLNTKEDSPQAAVIIDETNSLESYLREHRIGAWKWPGKELPKKVSASSDKYPIANMMNKKLVMLPVNSFLDEEEMNVIIERIRNYDHKE